MCVDLPGSVAAGGSTADDERVQLRGQHQVTFSDPTGQIIDDGSGDRSEDYRQDKKIGAIPNKSPKYSGGGYKSIGTYMSDAPVRHITHEAPRPKQICNRACGEYGAHQPPPSDGSDVPGFFALLGNGALMIADFLPSLETKDFDQEEEYGADELQLIEGEGMGSDDDDLAASAHCSFPEETPVLLANNTTKSIKDLKVGDKVWAKDPGSGKISSRAVEAVLNHRDTELAYLTVKDQKGRLFTLHTTPNHPFWDRTTQAWTRVDHLTKGDLLQATSNQYVAVINTVSYPAAAVMYNLTIAKIHTYYVLAGSTPILVHNTCDVGGTLRNWSSKRYQFGNAQFILGKNNFAHILQRHHPEYWDGSTKATQTFPDPDMSIDDVQDAIGSVLQQNREALMRGGGLGIHIRSKDHTAGLIIPWV